MFRLPKNNFILLETNRFDRYNCRTFLFTDPLRIISCYRNEDVKDAINEIESFISKGYYVAGFLSYEAGFSFEESLCGLKTISDFPLLWFGVYKSPRIFMHRQAIDFFSVTEASYTIKNFRPNITRRQYFQCIRDIKNLIERGETYQVNFTFKYIFDFDGSLENFYRDLKKRQGVRYSALIKIPDFFILSLSPELFFRKRHNYIEVRPMKGTIGRGRTIFEDDINANALKHSVKDRSENVMIVDLLRNDLGRISEVGRVETVKLFEVEKYETLFQMISIIKARLKSPIRLYELFKAIFPSGSVTGAPKINTMKIIHKIEKEPRRIYTGSIGFFSPYGEEGVFNVAIRTILVDRKKRRAEMGIGSGIVYDSDPYKEFEESKLKARFMIERKDDFRLIETMLWRPKKGYFLLNLHLNRLFSSARYFNFDFDKRSILSRLKREVTRFNKYNNYRVRMTMDRRGMIELSSVKIKKLQSFPKIRFSDKRVNSKNVFLYHKTTERTFYDKEYRRAQREGYLDVIFTNEKNQVTEGSISNIIIKKDGLFYTPPVDCGLLNGVFRQYLFKNKKIPLVEKILYKKDIMGADEIYLINSVRGMVRVIYDRGRALYERGP